MIKTYKLHSPTRTCTITISKVTFSCMYENVAHVQIAERCAGEGGPPVVMSSHRALPPLLVFLVAGRLDLGHAVTLRCHF